MTLQAPGNRNDFLFDLTRWNRAGLSRFQYVDGDAAVWLEELRIAMLGLYLREIDPEDRTPEKWRDVYLKQPQDRQLSGSPEEFLQAVDWKNLLPAAPAGAETAKKRNDRLLTQYGLPAEDYAWEIMRAFARASHILLGHQNAYANEGYLKTATQWENLKKLAAMVNYQPTPPASATSTVALQIEPGKGTIEIARGLAMKYAPPEGGSPLIFETLKPLRVHPDMNTVRAQGWNANLDNMNFTSSTTWIAPENAELAQGDPVVLTRDGMIGAATMILTVDRDLEAKVATLGFDPKPRVNWQKQKTLLLSEPEDVKTGLPKSSAGELVVATEGASSYPIGSIVRVVPSQSVSDWFYAPVKQATKGHLTLDSNASISGDVTVEPLTPFTSVNGSTIETPLNVYTLYYKRSAGGVPDDQFRTNIRYETEGDSTSESIASVHTPPANTGGPGYARIAGAKVTSGSVIEDVVWGNNLPDKSVRFEGKPPKTLSQGDWYVARPIGTNTLTAHKVSGIRIEADVHYIQFCPNPPVHHDQTEFFGPMTRTLRPVDYDRDQRDAIIGGVCYLQGLSAEAQDLVKSGRDVFVIDDELGQRRAGVAEITSVEPLAPDYKLVKLTLKGDETFFGWKSGWTSFHLNTIAISHGETKDPKTLGSGDAEKRRQDFQFKLTDVSFIPSNTSSTGVAPDMDVTVDGIKWEYRDIGDPTANGQDAWSVALNEDDTLQIHFRRRLPTGTNNIAVSRHRIGVGSKGTGIAPWSFDKPMKKNRFVESIIQPFTTAGGANREPVSDIRDNAPSKLAANGRAVALRDFERLCRRHSSIWQAKARQIIRPGADSHVDIVVVPAHGGLVNSTLEQDLIDFVASRALPNVHVSITAWTSSLFPDSLFIDPMRRFSKSFLQMPVLGFCNRYLNGGAGGCRRPQCIRRLRSWLRPAF